MIKDLRFKNRYIVIPSEAKQNRGISLIRVKGQIWMRSLHSFYSVGNDKLSEKNQVFQQGQALITLLFFTIVGVTLITAASFVTLGNVSSTSAAEQGTVAYFNAESGVEDALLLMLRYPKGSVSPTPYAGGTIPYSNGGSATITVDLNTGIILSTGTYGSAKREIQAQTSTGADGLQVTSWQEVNQ